MNSCLALRAPYLSLFLVVVPYPPQISSSLVGSALGVGLEFRDTSISLLFFVFLSFVPPNEKPYPSFFLPKLVVSRVDSRIESLRRVELPFSFFPFLVLAVAPKYYCRPVSLL